MFLQEIQYTLKTPGVRKRKDRLVLLTALCSFLKVWLAELWDEGHVRVNNVFVMLEMVAEPRFFSDHQNLIF